MTTQDFELIARVLREERRNHEDFPAQVTAIDNVSKAFSVVLSVGNRTRFDPKDFLRACGVERRTDES